MRLTRARPVLLTAAAVAVSACRTGTPAAGTDARLSGTFAGGWRFSELTTASLGSEVMVASNSDLASAAGVEIMKAGGNAVDAAVAVGFALAVTYPFAGNIGGGGFMTIRMADGRTAALDYREVAPLAATRNMFVDSTGKLTDARSSRGTSPRACRVLSPE
jgi:gamma-glutamyltranspeptidase / glutathione hydrolase